MKAIHRCYFLIVLFLASCNSSNTPDAVDAHAGGLRKAGTFIGKVVGVKDGDTIEVLSDDSSYTIRLADIDCPEKGQAFGNKAKQFTSDLCFSKEVRVESRGYDQYKRVLGTVYINEVVLNEELLKAGFAWHYVKYSHKPAYQGLENTARSKGIGLWTDENAEEPWNFRADKKKKETI